MSPEALEHGRGIRDQIERYRAAFTAVLTMVVLAAAMGGYIFAHERLNLPGWVPVIGKSYFTLKAEFQTAQALTPGQNQAVTIAGAKIGEIANVDLNDGVAVVSMNLTPKYARIYRNATALLRPKTQLQDMTLEIDPGTPAAGRLRSGAMIPLSQTAPNIDFDEFLSSLDSDTRAYLQELLAGLGEGFKNNGSTAAAVFKRFDPTAREVEEISHLLVARHVNIERSIHNFRLLIEALGGKDKQLADLIDSSNAVFATFAHEDSSVQNLLRLLPGALSKTKHGLGKLATAAAVLGPTLKKLEPFARSLAPANEASRHLFRVTTPIFAKEIRPFARQILPVIDQLQPATKNLAEAFPKLQTSFSVLNEFFNELAYNPGPKQGGFLFFLDWANHNLNSVESSADAQSALGQTLVYFDCKIVPILSGVAEVNPAVRLQLGLLNPPSESACLALTGAQAKSASVNDRAAVSKRATQLAERVFGQKLDTLIKSSGKGVGGG